LLSTIAFIFVLSVLVLVHEFGHFIIAKTLGVRVDVFSIGFGKKLFSCCKGDTEYRISLIPLGGYIKMAGDDPEQKREGKEWEFLSKPIAHRFAIIFAGPAFNYLLAFVLFSIVFFLGTGNLTTRIGEIKDGYPAQQAGLTSDDIVVAIDGQKVEYWHQLSEIIHSKVQKKEVDFSIKRQGELITLAIIPRVEKMKNILGQEVEIGLIGIGHSDELKVVRYGPVESILRGAQQTANLTALTCTALFRMFTGQMSLKESVTGPIGIFYITGKAAKMGFVYLLQIMASLSVSLGIVNLFPVPVLDGGHLLFLFIEKIKGKPVSVKFQENAMRVGLTVLVTLMLLIFYSDFKRFEIFTKIFSFFK